MLANQLQKTMLSWLAPACPLCRLPLAKQDTHGLCAACLEWYTPQPRCERCGLPSPMPVTQCGECLRSPPPWQRLICLGDYRFPLSQAVHKLKYQRQFWQAPSLAGLLATRITDPAPLLTSVPLHWRRYWLRGFNQSDLLARALSQALQCHYQPQLLQRVRATAMQQGLNKRERTRNLTQAFRLSEPPASRHIAIVDDVVTTGSTMRQLCNLLLDVGVKRLDIYCICRTPEPGS
ncbi:MULTISPECIES: phosphoribosyltransferase family protein [Vibrio]|uniref:ComF family protein n=1 Tax=Vibrio ostreae TaxID=2841925 RepID=A0A975UBQ4_9VIBR|nr:MULTISPECIES: phosphoribosyltransferase family protein [Vibrio]QXO17549.1 ComF family protein [Vibrio ostreae]WGY48139.1 ComF family protein [Vibrio sp. ABG19]